MNIKVNYVWVDFDRKWLNKRYYCTVGMMKRVILRGKNRFYLYLQRKVFLSLALSMQFLYLCNLHPSLSLYSSLSLCPWRPLLSIFKERWRKWLEGILFHHWARDGAWHLPLSERRCCLGLVRFSGSPFLWLYVKKVQRAKSLHARKISLRPSLRGKKKINHLSMTVCIEALGRKSREGIGSSPSEPY